jgi:hypothetical protein
VKILQVVAPVKEDTQSVHSESDNEGVNEEDLNNLDDEFEKIVPSKIDEIDSIELTGEDQEIVEILGESENLQNPVKLDVVDDATTNINIADAGATVESEEIEKKIESDTLEAEKIDIKKEEKTANENSADSDSDAVVSSVDKTDNAITSSEINSEEITGTEVEETKSKETIIDEDLLPREAILKFIAESSAEKPVIPLQTYLWEDVKRAKERVSNDQVCVFHMCTVPI